MRALRSLQPAPDLAWNCRLTGAVRVQSDIIVFAASSQLPKIHTEIGTAGAFPTCPALSDNWPMGETDWVLVGIKSYLTVPAGA